MHKCVHNIYSLFIRIFKLLCLYVTRIGSTTVLEFVQNLKNNGYRTDQSWHRNRNLNWYSLTFRFFIAVIQNMLFITVARIEIDIITVSSPDSEFTDFPAHTRQVAVSLGSVARCLLVSKSKILETCNLHGYGQIDHRMPHDPEHIFDTLFRRGKNNENTDFERFQGSKKERKKRMYIEKKNI